jgi:hypothetical protein
MTEFNPGGAVPRPSFTTAVADTIERILDMDSIPPGGAGFAVWSPKHGQVNVTVTPGPGPVTPDGTPTPTRESVAGGAIPVPTRPDPGVPEKAGAAPPPYRVGPLPRPAPEPHRNPSGPLGEDGMPRWLTAILIAVVVALLVAGAVSLLSHHADTAGYETPADVIAMLEAEGLDVSSVRETRSMSGAVDEVDARIEGRESGVLLFDDRDELDSWLEVSRDFGGIAVTRGDEPWALSLPSTLGDGAGADLRHAETIAEAIDGEVH